MTGQQGPGAQADDERDRRDATVEFRAVAKVSEIGPGQLRPVDLDGALVCLANVDGTFYAIAGECAHAGGLLADGALDGAIITCPLHGAMFDVTSGEVLGPPADDSQASHEVQIQGDEVQVAVEPRSPV